MGRKLIMARTKGPPCAKCKAEMKPLQTRMFGDSWKCANSDCGVAYRIDWMNEKEMFDKMLKEASKQEE